MHTMIDQRFHELHRRMTAAGGGPKAFSALEMHELSDGIDELLADVERYRADVERNRQLVDLVCQPDRDPCTS